ncbi:type II toxin-antitoxin system PemK/MazF family toxin [Lacrimispora sp. 38-1]|uniref:type II toxin-antitoxin system PemK/MazF family toxin n=1 Tax=Lacrimispora sp. 38-1 TaxID=3125778 RepID=UPI003CEF355E
MKIRRGDILYAELGTSRRGSIQTGIRPVVVVSNNKANQFSTVYTVVPLTTKLFKKRNLPTHVFVSAHTSVGLEQHSIALCEQVTSIIDDDVIENLGQVDKYTLSQITEAVKVQIGAYEKYNI